MKTYFFTCTKHKQATRLLLRDAMTEEVSASSPLSSPHSSPEREDKEEADMMQIYDKLDASVKYKIQLSMGIVVINNVTLPAKKIHVSGLSDRAIYERLVEQGILFDNKFKIPTFLEPTDEFLDAYDGPKEIHISYVESSNIGPKLYSGDNYSTPCNPHAWHDLYIKKSHTKQRKKVTWENIVDKLNLPQEWKTMRFSKKK